MHSLLSRKHATELSAQSPSLSLSFSPTLLHSLQTCNLVLSCSFPPMDTHIRTKIQFHRYYSPCSLSSLLLWFFLHVLRIIIYSEGAAHKNATRFAMYRTPTEELTSKTNAVCVQHFQLIKGCSLIWTCRFSVFVRRYIFILYGQFEAVFSNR